MKEQVFDTVRYPDLTATVDAVAWPFVGEHHDQPTAVKLVAMLNLSVKGKVAILCVPLVCHENAKAVTCDVQSVVWDMRLNGIRPPQFLALQVLPEVEISGQIIFTRYGARLAL